MYRTTSPCLMPDVYDKVSKGCIRVRIHVPYVNICFMYMCPIYPMYINRKVSVCVRVMFSFGGDLAQERTRQVNQNVICLDLPFEDRVRAYARAGSRCLEKPPTSNSRHCEKERGCDRRTREESGEGERRPSSVPRICLAQRLPLGPAHGTASGGLAFL